MYRNLNLLPRKCKIDAAAIFYVIQKSQIMCRNIKTLFNFDPLATDDEIHASALQYVRKISGYTKPSKINEATFNQAVEDVFQITKNLIYSLQTNAPSRNREVEAAKARARAAKRFGLQ